MTAEVAIINRTAVALAADSAVTIGRERVWKHSSKLFLLSDYNDIAIMIHNAADYRGVPWQIIIKQFRKKIADFRFPSLGVCVAAFLHYLAEFPLPTRREDLEKDASEVTPLSIIVASAAHCLKSDDYIKAVGRRSQKAAFMKSARKFTRDVKRDGVNFGVSFKDFDDRYGKAVDSLLSEKVEFHITAECRKAFAELCHARLNGAYASDFDTGIVFAGYGEDEVFPVLIDLTVDSAVCDKPRAWVRRQSDMNDDLIARIIPFGQTDIAYLYMEGILPDYLDFIGETVNGTLREMTNRLLRDYVPEGERVVERERQKRAREQLMKKFAERFKKRRDKVSVSPVVKALGSLPKEEMAALAESLIEITSLRRKVDSALETVAEPIDVAVISKADGFVWIKRKHYFDVALNQDFLYRRSQRYGGFDGFADDRDSETDADTNA